MLHVLVKPEHGAEVLSWDVAAVGIEHAAHNLNQTIGSHTGVKRLDWLGHRGSHFFLRRLGHLRNIL